MDEYYRVVEALPLPLSEELGKLPPGTASSVQEIRLRAGQPVQFTIQGRLIPCTAYLPMAKLAAYLKEEELQSCFLHLCRYSVYAYEEELQQGFFTVRGGHRVGVAGNRSGKCFSSVTSLNLRVARWITCDLPFCVRGYLNEGEGGLLIAGVPGSGKTTFLRTLIQFLGQKQEIICVVDERGELLAGERNRLPQAQRICCDVYTRCSKAEGIDMALRCMNPRYIICDELGTVQDANALEQGVASGVRFLASVHCEAAQDLDKKPQIRRLLQTGAFSRAIFLKGRDKPGHMAQWVEL